MDRRIVLLGERHADPAAPEKVRSVLSRLGEFTFCIELPGRVEHALRSFLKTRDEELLADPVFAEQPAKLSDAHIDLYADIAKDHAIRCVDVDELPDRADVQDWREQALANNIAAIPGRVVALLGDVHAAKVPLEVAGVGIVPAAARLEEPCYTINLSGSELPGYDEVL